MVTSATDIEWFAGPALAPGWPQSLPQWWQQAAQRSGLGVVLEDGPSLWNWQQLLDTAQRWAADPCWQGVLPGSRVLICAANGVDHLLAELACWLRGGVAVPVAAHLPGAVLVEIRNRVAPVLCLGDAAAPALLQAQPIAAWAQAQGHRPWPIHAAEPDDPALILFTSGSSGRPKGVVLSHRNICSQQAAFAALWPDCGPGDRVVGYLPWYHSFGALAERLWVMGQGMRLIIAPAGGHDAEALVSCLAKHQPQVFMSVPKLHHVVAQSGVLRAAHTRWVFTAGAPLGAAAEAAYACSGIAVVEGWGLTEASPSVTISRPHQPRGGGLVGHPIPGVAVGCAADGEILIRSPGVMLGYLDDAYATGKALISCDGERVLRSGDLGHWCEHGLVVEGRRDQQLKHPNGEKVPRARLEQELARLPGIADLVLAIDEGVQGLVALVLPQPGAAMAELCQALRQRNRDCAVPWWRVRLVACLCGRASVDNGIFTASHKLSQAGCTAHWRSYPHHWQTWDLREGAEAKWIPGNDHE
ncbi:MAG: hypothetical protein EA402_13180 [Planctomycetota bacterium]|nr:MAG: hypothetical protein EA402_13180 [Planctomycetota bacterium]